MPVHESSFGTGCSCAARIGHANGHVHVYGGSGLVGALDWRLTLFDAGISGLLTPLNTGDVTVTPERAIGLLALAARVAALDAGGFTPRGERWEGDERPKGQEYEACGVETQAGVTSSAHSR